MSPQRGQRPRGAAPIRPATTTTRRAPAARPRRGGGRAHARQRGAHLRLPRLPAGSRGSRLLAAVMAIALTAALVGLVNGPWLRISTVQWTGAQYTPGTRLSAMLAPLRGTSLLAVDAGTVAAELATLPTVASAHVETRFPNGVAVQLTEKPPAVLWSTRTDRFVLSADGVVIAEVAPGAKLTSALAALPAIVDDRGISLDLAVGDRVAADDLATALELRAIDPAALGSRATSVNVSITDACGYALRPSPSGAWTAIFGTYELLAGDGRARTARIADQVAAVRTLFATEKESAVGWLDVRNPGKVYWRPAGRGGSAC